MARAYLDGRRVMLEFPYDDRLVEAVRRIPGRQFDPTDKTWSFPLTSLAQARQELADTYLGKDLTAVARRAERRAALRPPKLGAPMASARPDAMQRLFPHQREAVEFVLRSRVGKGVLIGDDMGLGKTRTAAVVADALAGTEGRIVVVCPAAVKINWAREIRISLGDDAGEVRIVKSSKSALSKARWHLVNYDILRRQEMALDALRPAVIVLDESHYIKERRSSRTGAALHLAKSAKSVVLLSGTPLKNRSRELITQLGAIGHPVVADVRDFLLRYCDPQPSQYAAGGFTYDGSSNTAELRTRISDAYIARKKSDVLDLPPKVRAWLPVEIDEHAYHTHMDAIVSRIVAGELDGVNALALLTHERVATSLAKIVKTIDVAREVVANDEKVVVFTAFSSALTTIAAAFPGALTLDGSVSAEERQKRIDAFRSDPDARVFVANIIAGGVGVTLTAATQVVMHDLVWTPADHLQAEDRTYRIGQTEMVNVTYVVGESTVDNVLSQALDRKLQVLSTFDAGASPASLFSDSAVVDDAKKALIKKLKAEIKAAKKSKVSNDGAMMERDGIDRIVDELDDARFQRAQDSVIAPPKKKTPRPLGFGVASVSDVELRVR